MKAIVKMIYHFLKGIYYLKKVAQFDYFAKNVKKPFN